MKKFTVIVFSFLIIAFACKSPDSLQESTQGSDSTDVTDPDTTLPENHHISFRNIIHSRTFVEGVDSTQLFVFYNLADQQAFLDTTNTITSHINFSAYDDSMVIAIIFGEEISLSSTFSIDSLVADSNKNEISVYSHLYFPVGQMSYKSTQSHFIAIEKTNMGVVFEEIQIIEEQASGEIIPFVSFLKGSDGFASNPNHATLILLKDEEDESAFLDSISYFTDFPDFDYSDSMLVGVISKQFNHVTPFEIVSLIKRENLLEVTGNYFYGGMLPAISQPFHFVAIEQMNVEVKIDTIRGFYSWIE